MSFNTIFDKNQEKNENIYDFNTYLEIGSFEYIPKKFLDIDTNTFGNTKLNSFLKLKQKLLEDNSSLNNNISFQDKCQGIRYLCHIPHKDKIKHVMECCKNVLENEEYDIDQRYYFFSNNEKYFKLDDHIVFECYPLFFNLCIERNYPLLFTLLCSKYIISTVPNKDLIDKAKTILYNISSDTNETIQFRCEAIDTLLEYGSLKDREFAKLELEKLGNNYYNNMIQTIYTNTQNVHDESINTSIRNMLRSLIKNDLKYKSEKEYQIEDIHNFIIDYCNKNESNYSIYLDTLKRLMTDPSKYEGKNLCNIILMVWKKINSFEESIKLELYKRFIQELHDMIDTCSSGHLSRILNILSGYIEDKDYQLKINPIDSLRSSIFARLNSELRKLGINQQEEILLALSSSNKEDKLVLEEYISYYSPKDELQEEYKELMKEDEFEEVYNKTINEYMGL
jgi:hypothetical protein